MNRREYVVCCGLSIAGVIAGCSGTDGNQETDTDSSDDEDSQSPNESDSSPSNESDSTDDQSNHTSESDGPEDTEEIAETENRPIDVITAFYSATETLDIEAINDILHSEMPGRATAAHFGASGFEFQSIEVSVIGTEIDADELNYAPFPEDETEILLEATSVFTDSGGETHTGTEHFVLVTADDEWKLWDFAPKRFHVIPQILEITAVDGIVGESNEVTELRIGVSPTDGSGEVDLSNVIMEYIVLDPNATPKNTSNIWAHEDITGDTHPENVSPEVVEVDGSPQDRFGVSVGTAQEPENLRLTEPTDECQLVIDTSGGETDEGYQRLLPLEPGDSMQVTLETETGTPAGTDVDIPDLDEYSTGEVITL